VTGGRAGIWTKRWSGPLCTQRPICTALLPPGRSCVDRRRNTGLASDRSELLSVGPRFRHAAEKTFFESLAAEKRGRFFHSESLPCNTSDRLGLFKFCKRSTYRGSSRKMFDSQNDGVSNSLRLTQIDSGYRAALRPDFPPHPFHRPTQLIYLYPA